MEKFNDQTTAGNERAIKRGVVVPEGGVNLSWVKSPQLTPKDNMVIIDTSRAIQENLSDFAGGCKLFTANELGVLESDDGTVIQEEFPSIADIFNVDEDFSTVEGNEYTDAAILPFRHTSRFFHLDKAGMSIGSMARQIQLDYIKVVDEKGREYLDKKGKRLYRIEVIPATANFDQAEWAYRVNAYLDILDGKDLYLLYNKVEVLQDGNFGRQNLNHKERINPQPYFEYLPEESEVVDPANRRKKIYSSKPMGLKKQAIGGISLAPDAWDIYVPRKAIPDPRNFQLFRWRVACDFIENTQVDPVSIRGINVGVVVTNDNPNSATPYAFHNMENSPWNATGVRFRNPLYETQNPNVSPNKETRDYWQVNIDNLEAKDLKLFDVLLWSIDNNSTDLSRYNQLISVFTENLGGTILFETANLAGDVQGLNITVSAPTDSFTGIPKGPGADTKVTGGSIAPTSLGDIIIKGNTNLGGWDLGAEELRSISDHRYKPTSYFQLSPSYIQCITNYPADFRSIFQGRESNNTIRSVAIAKSFDSGGNIFFSTMGLCGRNVNTLRSNLTNAWLSPNSGPVRWDTPIGSVYPGVLTYPGREGAYKAFFNMCLLATKGTLLDDNDQYSYSTVWTAVTPWKGSWVIDGTKLYTHERDQNDFTYQPKDPSDNEATWQRRLSSLTLKQMVEESLSVGDRDRIRSASAKIYRIEVTNPEVETPTTLDDNTLPMAWTEAYSPGFFVPADFGPHIITEEQIAANFKSGQYLSSSYPDKPYNVRVRSNFANTGEINTIKTALVQLQGTATETTITKTPTYTTNTEIRWDTHGDATFYPSPHLPDFGVRRPKGIATYSQENYYTSNTYGFYGFFHKMQRGSTGQFVVWLQHFLNRLMALGGFGTSAGHLKQDGSFGPVTAQAVLDFQNTFQARYKDGQVDAETYSIIGGQILRFGPDAFIRPRSSGFPLPPGEWTGIYDWPGIMMQKQALSDGRFNSAFSVSSWNVGGAPWIVDAFSIKFPESYNFHTIRLTPFVPTFGQKQVFIDSIDVWGDGSSNVETIRSHMRGWNPVNARFPVKQWVPDSQSRDFRIGPFNGNTITVVLSQVHSPNINNSTARVMGLRELTGWAQTSRGGHSTVSTRQIQVTASVPVIALKNVRRYAITPNYSGDGTLSNVNWTNITNLDEETFLEPGFEKSGLLNGVYLRLESRDARGHQMLQASHGEVYVQQEAVTRIGVDIPGQFIYYSMDENGVRSPLPETGFISKKDGLKLLCTPLQTPYGFPPMPTGVGSSEAQSHYVTLSLESVGTDPSVKYGFYDINKKEFILDSSGLPVMSYLDYMERGPNNIFVGLISDYEESTSAPLPIVTDAPTIPFRWAKPVYGVCYKKQTKIGIEPLPDDLGPNDMWYIPIRIGRFVAPVAIPERQDLPITGWARDYVGQTLKAFYAIPEAEKGGWSLVYGRPNYDIVGENPLILGDNVIQIRQAPILMVTEPTPNPSGADPVRPIFKIYTRTSIVDAWTEMNMQDVLDYNIHSGEIFLRNPLATLDSNLIKVDYTTPNKSYHFKGYGGNRLNLNPYPGYDRSLIGRPIYVYILPQYVASMNGQIISESVNETTIRYTIEPNIFNPLRPEYDPTALQLGVVYITTSVDIQQLIMLDTRRRGGGVRDSLLMSEIKRMVSESHSHWDIGYGAGMSYQRGGFVVIRLPRAIKDEFPNENDIIEAIERNISAGVQYIIEDSEGNSW